MSQIFFFFQTGDTNIFVLGGFFFSRYVQQHQQWNPRRNLVEKQSELNLTKY